MTPDEELESLDRLIARLEERPLDELPPRLSQALCELHERRWRLRWAIAGVSSALEPGAGDWPPPSPGSHGQPDRSEQLVALERLCREVTALVTRLAAEPARPYLTVYLDAAFADRVFVGPSLDGVASYVWAGGHAAHPVSDPLGAARAVAATLANQRWQAQEHP